MRILAYADKRYLRATMKVVGREADLLLSPPLRAMYVQPELLRGYDVLYLDLHGEYGDTLLYGDGVAALSMHTVLRSDLTGTTVVATTCYLPETPFLAAFREAGATVIGGYGKNWGARWRVMGAQALARALLRRLKKGLTPKVALEKSKSVLERNVARWFDRGAINDALKFELWEAIV